MPSENRIELHWTPTPDDTIGDLMMAIASTVLEMRERHRLGYGKAIPLRLTSVSLVLEQPHLDETERALVQKARTSGVDLGRQFESPEAVRVFFSRDVINATASEGSPLRAMTDDELGAMADAVITSRYNCAF